MENWRDEFLRVSNLAFTNTETFGGITMRQEKFIEKEIIEKLIDEIPTGRNFLNVAAFKQQLRDKWLTK